MKCTNCQAEIDNSAKFCPICGHKVETAQFCSNCGTKLNEGDKFCPKCGTPCIELVNEPIEGQKEECETIKVEEQAPQQAGINETNNIFDVTPVEYYVCTQIQNYYTKGEIIELISINIEDFTKYGITKDRLNELLTYTINIDKSDQCLEPNFNIRIRTDEKSLIDSLPIFLQTYGNKHDKLVYPFIPTSLFDTIKQQHSLANDSTVLYYRIINNDHSLIITSKGISYYDKELDNNHEIRWSDFEGLTQIESNFVFLSFHHDKSFSIESYDVIKMSTEEAMFCEVINNIAWSNAIYDSETKTSSLPPSDYISEGHSIHDQIFLSITEAVTDCVFHRSEYVSKEQVKWAFIGIPFYLSVVFAIFIICFAIFSERLMDKIAIPIVVIVIYRLIQFFKMLKRRSESRSLDEEVEVSISFGGRDWLWIIATIVSIIVISILSIIN